MLAQDYWRASTQNHGWVGRSNWLETIDDPKNGTLLSFSIGEPTARLYTFTARQQNWSMLEKVAWRSCSVKCQ